MELTLKTADTRESLPTMMTVMKMVIVRTERPGRITRIGQTVGMTCTMQTTKMLPAPMKWWTARTLKIFDAQRTERIGSWLWWWRMQGLNFLRSRSDQKRPSGLDETTAAGTYCEVNLAQTAKETTDQKTKNFIKGSEQASGDGSVIKQALH